MAAEAGVDLGSLQGTGPQGRIIKRDIEAALAAAPAAPLSPAGSQAGLPPRARSLSLVAAREVGPESQDVELSAVRRTIAKRLVQSKGPVPHFYLTIDVAMDRVWDAYKALRDQKSSISVNDIIVKAAALALRQHPEINASFAGDHIKVFSRVHIGMAVALEDGLITPILRDADLKPLEEISEEARSLAERARAKKLQPNEYTGATFSISQPRHDGDRGVLGHHQPAGSGDSGRRGRKTGAGRGRRRARDRLADEGHALGGSSRGRRRGWRAVPADPAERSWSTLC